MTRRAHAAQRAAQAPPADMPGPAAVEVAARHVRIGDDWAATLAVTGYPAEVSPGWLEPLLSLPRAASTSPCTSSRSPLRWPRPGCAASAPAWNPAAAPAPTGASWTTRTPSPPPTTPASWPTGWPAARASCSASACTSPSTPAREDELAAEVAAVRAAGRVAAAGHRPGHLPLPARAGSRRCPAGTDQLMLRRTMDTAALAASFPFTCPDLPRDPASPDALPGVLYGANTAGPGLVAWDRWAQPTTTTPSPSPRPAPGSPTSPSWRSSGPLYQGTECWVIDPEDEYARLAACRRRRVRAPGRRRGAPEPVRPARRRARPRPDALTRRALFIHTVIAVLLGGQPPPGGAGRPGPGDHDRLPARPGSPPTPAPGPGPPRCCPPWPPRCAPAKTDGRDRAGGPAGPVHRGHPLRRCSPGRPPPAPTATSSSSRLRDVPDELNAAATLLALDATWRQVSDPAQPPAPPHHRR